MRKMQSSTYFRIIIFIFYLLLTAQKYRLKNNMYYVLIISWDHIKGFCKIILTDSSVGIVIHYGLDGLGIESRWGRDFPHSSRLALGPTQPPIQWVFPRGKAAEVWR
jgi:hypothetical protein